MGCSWTDDSPLGALFHAPSALLIDDIDGDGDNRDVIMGHDDHKNELYLFPNYQREDVDSQQFITLDIWLADLNNDGCLEFLVGNLIKPPGGGGSIGDGQNVYYTLGSSFCNAPPFANPDSVTTTEDTCVNIAVLGNDGDPNGDTITLIDANLFQSKSWHYSKFWNLY